MATEVPPGADIHTSYDTKECICHITKSILGPDQNLVPVGVTKLCCDFQLDKYMRGLKMYDGLFRTVA